MQPGRSTLVPSQANLSYRVHRQAVETQPGGRSTLSPSKNGVNQCSCSGQGRWRVAALVVLTGGTKQSILPGRWVTSVYTLSS